MKINYYRILGIENQATFEQIKKAYRNLAIKYHPDKNQGDMDSEERFKLVKEAYDVLKDVKKREEYDRLISTRKRAQQKVFSSDGSDMFIPEDEVLGDFIKGFYSYEKEKDKKPKKGKDVRLNIKVTFEEAALGTYRELKIPSEQECEQCHGTGIKAGAKQKICSGCRGRGKVRGRKGLFEDCGRCRGEGFVFTAYCKKCRGSGFEKTFKKINIDVAPGTDTGTRIFLQGMGLNGKEQGAAGDFFAVVNVQKHEFLIKSGNDIILELTVPFFKALLGGKIEIPTLHGIKSIKIPAGSKTGDKIKLPEMGIKKHKNSNKKGNMVISIVSEMPGKLKKHEKDLLKELERNADIANFPDSKKYNQKLIKYKSDRGIKK